MTDDEKHADCRKRGFPHAVFLPENLYIKAERAGFDMNSFVVQKPIPIESPK